MTQRVSLDLAVWDAGSGLIDQSGMETGYTRDLSMGDVTDPDATPYTEFSGRTESVTAATDGWSCHIDRADGKLKAVDLYEHLGKYGEFYFSGFPAGANFSNDPNYADFATVAHADDAGFRASGNVELVPWAGLYKIEFRVVVTASGLGPYGAFYDIFCGGGDDHGYICHYLTDFKTGGADTGLLTGYSNMSAGGALLCSICAGADPGPLNDQPSGTFTVDPSQSFARATWIGRYRETIRNPRFTIPPWAE